MDADAFQLILGLLFADGRLSRTRTPRSYIYRATFEGGVGEREVLEEKLFEVDRAIGTRAKIDSYISGKQHHLDESDSRIASRGTKVLRFRVASKQLAAAWPLLRPQGQRRITSSLLERLGGRAAAWLWSENVKLLPEEHSNESGAILRRVGDDFQEAALVAEWLARLTGSQAVVSEPGKFPSPRLVFDRDQKEMLQATLLPFAPFSRRNLFKA